MPASADVVYLDSSAIVKLVVQERESEALRSYLIHTPILASSDLARVEVPRAVWRYGDAAHQQSRQVLMQLRLLRLDVKVLTVAAGLLPPGLRSLDAIHIASAQAFQSELRALVTYDYRMAEAANSLGLAVEAPS